MAVHVLTVHATYQCRQSGVCCDAGWPVPVEADRLPALDAAIARGSLVARIAGDPFERRAEAPIETPVRLARPDGRCTFFDRSPAGASCRVHTALGHAALPLACRQFPRITVHDPRGPAVTLSHYCPTAAALLARDAPVAITTDAPGFPAGGEYVGLDARRGLPPLLRPDMAMDWESWWALERQAVDLVANGRDSLARDLARLSGMVEQVRTWSPGAEPLGEAVARAHARSAPQTLRDTPAALLQHLRDATPEALRTSRPAAAGATVSDERTRRRFLSAHAFANWTAYLGLDLRAWVASIALAEACLAAGWTVGQADLAIRHLADPWRLAELLSGAERS